MTTHSPARRPPPVGERFGTEQDRIDLERWESESPMFDNRAPRSEAEAAEAQSFADPPLQAQYERCLAEVDPSSIAVRHVCALVALHDWVQMLEGAHSPRVHATIEQLLLPHLRLELCQWLQPSPTAKASPLRDQLLHSVAEN